MKSSLFGVSLMIWLCACSPQQENASQTSSSQPNGSTESASQGSHTHEGEVDHHSHAIPGPNGGKLIASVDPHLEFWMQPEDGHARITFVNDDIEPIDAVSLPMSLTMGDRNNPTTIEFEQRGSVFVSTQALSAEGNPPVILEIGSTDGGEIHYERFHLNLDTCSDCKLKEYACICGHEPHSH